MGKINKNSEDEDYKFLIKYKEELFSLEEPLNAFIKKYKDEDFKGSRESEEFIVLETILDSLLAKDYRKNVSGKHSQEFSQPT